MSRSQAPKQILGEPNGRARPLGEKHSEQKAQRSRTIGMKPAMRVVGRYPSVFVGLAIIVLLIGISVYTLTVTPYKEMVRLWRGEGDVWLQNPRKALPQWVNLFRRAKLPPSVILDSRDSAGAARKRTEPASEGVIELTLSFPFDFRYDEFPQDMVIRFDAQYREKKPHVSLVWLTPDGRQIDMGSLSIASSRTYYLSQDHTLQRKLGGALPLQAMFADPVAETPVPLQGAYELRVSGLLFEEEADLDAKFLLHGRVYGLAGTDDQRRDLLMGLLWGMPVALSFGLVGAIVTATGAMVIAAVSTWYGGWTDHLIQRITEVNMILPVIPICITLYLASAKSIWVILGLMVLLSVFGSAIKNYRAIFLQVKEEPHIEAARAYGASDRRIVLRYLIPRIFPVLIPQLIILIPSFVFLEAMLAYLGVSDPGLPTWGKLIEAGISHGLYTGAYHMLLLPLGLVLLVGLAFVMLSLTLERIFQSRLRKL